MTTGVVEPLSPPLTTAAPPPVPAPAAPTEGDVIDRLVEIERELMHERFSEFERGVLQDNIALCDEKSGILLALAGGLAIFCLDALKKPMEGREFLTILTQVDTAAFAVGAVAFLSSCYFSLSSVRPRMRRTVSTDHIFWESTVFRQPADAYVATMHALDPKVERDDKLRHLHTLAGICRNKFAAFRNATLFGIAGFGALVVAQIAQALN